MFFCNYAYLFNHRKTRGNIEIQNNIKWTKIKIQNTGFSVVATARLPKVSYGGQAVLVIWIWNF